MARCLVVGANGFIGSHLVDSLIGQGHTVKAFGRFSRDPLFNDHDNVEIINGDFLNRSDMASALEGVEYVFHFISTTTPITADNDPQIDIETNVHMTIELLHEAVEKGVKKVIFASTSSLYGAQNGTPCKETDVPEPISPYTIGKLTIEHYLRYFKVKHGLQSVSFRISNPFGERQPLNRKQGVIPIFMEHVYRDEPITVLGDGTMARDYIYVKDVAQIIASIFEKENQHEVYNLGSGKSVTVNELIKNIKLIADKQIKEEHKDAPPTFVHTVALDTSRFIEEYGVQPNTSLIDGMRATWKYIVSEHEKDQ